MSNPSPRPLTVSEEAILGVVAAAAAEQGRSQPLISRTSVLRAAVDRGLPNMAARAAWQVERMCRGLSARKPWREHEEQQPNNGTNKSTNESAEQQHEQDRRQSNNNSTNNLSTNNRRDERTQ